PSGARASAPSRPRRDSSTVTGLTPTVPAACWPTRFTRAGWACSSRVTWSVSRRNCSIADHPASCGPSAPPAAHPPLPPGVSGRGQRLLVRPPAPLVPLLPVPPDFLEVEVGIGVILGPPGPLQQGVAVREINRDQPARLYPLRQFAAGLADRFPFRGGRRL